MGLPLVKMELAPIKEDEIVHERYHHPRYVGPQDPNIIAHEQTCLMLPATAYYVEGEERPKVRRVGCTWGHTSYDWTE